MLRITIPAAEYYDEINEVFITIDRQTLELEHSLFALSKWESKWHKPFLDKKQKTIEESLDYVRCMTLNDGVDPLAYSQITGEQFKQINDYMQDSMTATWFADDKSQKPNREKITAELIYYWMVSLNIPFECQYWHLNRLLTLIKVCSIKNQPPKKLGKKGLAKRNSSLNAARRAKLHSKG